MSIERLFNHSVRIFREPDLLSQRDEKGGVSPDPQPIMDEPDDFNARPDQRFHGTQRDSGPGEGQSRLQTWYLHKALDVRARDILLVVAGPETGRTLRVMAANPVSGRRNLHHWEPTCEDWIGTLSDAS